MTEKEPDKFGNLSAFEWTIYTRRILPLSFLSCLIWFISALVFGIVLTTPEWEEIFWLIYIVFITINFVLFLIVFYSAKAGKNIFSLILSLVLPFLAGILTVPIYFIFRNYNSYIYSNLSLGIGGVVIVIILSWILKEKFLMKGYVAEHIIILVLLIAAIEVSLVLLLGITSVPTIVLSIFFLFYITFIILFYGSNLAKKIKEEYWMYWSLKILAVLVFSIVAIILLIVVFLLMLVAGDGSFDIGTPSGGGGRSSAKKKQLKNDLKEI